MSLIYELLKKERWKEFFEYKDSKSHISQKEKDELSLFIETEAYKECVLKIISEEAFPIPEIKKINKKNSSKKRLVFTFEKTENYVLKMLSFLLYKYDFLFSDNLYSFRRDISVKSAISRIVHHSEIRKMYSYKVDISDYFNSIDTDRMTAIIKEKISDDKLLADFLISLIQNPDVYENGIVTTHKKGIMAGVPISGFLANLYLMQMDEYFAQKGILYARYSDDIIVFANNKSEIEAYENKIKDYIKFSGLEINPEKECRSIPSQKWEFLGFSYFDGEVDISEIALQKIKAKMKRKSRALVRWKIRKKAGDERAIKAFISHFNKKFFDNPIHNDITWCRWYFPIITTEKNLKKIDNYMIECIRYIATGKHTKANYNLRYETIKSYGYKSLVNSYYKRKKSFVVDI